MNLESAVTGFERRFLTTDCSTRKLEQLPHWVKVTEVFKSDSDTPFLKRAGINVFDDPRYERYSQRLAKLRAIRRYSYRIDVLERTLDYDEVIEIFVRVNSLGTKLRSSDLALAQITAKWRNSLATFQQFQKQCAKDGFDLDLGIHLKNLVAFATGKSRFLTVGSIPLEALQAAWKNACKGMEFALNFLKSNTGIDNPPCSPRPSCSSRSGSTATGGITTSARERSRNSSFGPCWLTPKGGTPGDRARRFSIRIWPYCGTVARMN